MPSRFCLDRKINSQCTRNCNKDDRREGKAINDICQVAKSIVDSMPVRCVGTWAEQKIYLIAQYLGIFATGMYKKWKVNYIEICSGPGRCIDRKTGFEFDGTSLAVINHESFKYITKALFFDYSKQVVETLNSRIDRLGKTKAKAYYGNYFDSSSICDVVKREVDPYSLCLVFIDPTDCSVPFSLLEDLHSIIPNMDLIINLASGTDFNRNALNIISDPVKYRSAKAKYERFLGIETFFSNITSPEGIKMKFRNAYVNRLKCLGLVYTDIKEVEQFYDIIFASASLKGIEFWKKALKYEYDGQLSLF